MQLKVLLPARVLVSEDAVKVTAEAQNGSFCLLPRHVDFVTALVPGVLIYETPEGAERFLGLDRGTLVKCGPEVLVSTSFGVAGDDLEELRRFIKGRLRELDERETAARGVMARLEAGMVRHFIELKEAP